MEDYTQACLLLSLKSERTTNQLHISLEPDHDPNPVARKRRHATRNGQSPTIIYQPERSKEAMLIQKKAYLT